MASSDKTIPVRVAIRIRPLVRREVTEGCQEALDVTKHQPQVVVRGTDKAFTFDYAFGSDTTQLLVYESAVKKVVRNLFKGYNVTVLAYGQTGSGKTHSMGTTYRHDADDDDEMGIIPRAVTDIFEGIQEHSEHSFSVRVSFLELYKEVLYDLLSSKGRDDSVVDIREDPRGGIKVVGLEEILVTDLNHTMTLLEQGAIHRATGATAMNATSSRSHAIFSVHIEMRSKEGGAATCSKFHLVDLAGSERAKKTRATGERFKEGININKGLLALGNVISALCEETPRGHIPYRDSKLTRLLQDSLGGNSHTVMLACVSPADSNLEESLSTLRYADRTRKIKNKPIVNADPNDAEINKLRLQVQHLQVQLLTTQTESATGSGGANGAEVTELRSRCHNLEAENEDLTAALNKALDERIALAERAIIAESASERLREKLRELQTQADMTLDVLSRSTELNMEEKEHHHVGLFREFQIKVSELQAEQQRAEKQLVEHELSRHHLATMSDVENIGVDEINESGGEERLRALMKEFGPEFTLRQAKMNDELQDLNRALAQKEELMNRVSCNDQGTAAMKVVYEKQRKDLEDRIEALAKEKDELCQQLRANANPAAVKVSEQRRKRVQELESQITELKRKQLEQAKLLRLKEVSELKSKQLCSEIQAMKATRVKLVRQMKEDNDRFRQWKSKKDREVAQLKEADRRKQFQMVQMERLHCKQQNVLRRKMEEAVGINKRLKEAMAVQKAGVEKRAGLQEGGSIGARVRSWLDAETNVAVARKQARHSLLELVEARKAICSEITAIKTQLENEPLTLAKAKDLQSKQQALEADLQLQSAQINDLQSKVMDVEDDRTSQKRFGSMKSMVEAKLAAQYLFEIATDAQAATALKISEMSDVQNQYDEAVQFSCEMERDLKSISAAHQQEMSRVLKEHEDKIFFLSRKITKAEGGTENTDDSEADLLERLKFQEQQLVKLSDLQEELAVRTKECEMLKSQLAEADPDRKFVLPEPTSWCPKGNKKRNVYRRDTEENRDDSDEEEIDNDRPDDPDWVKTPLFSKIRELKRQIKLESKIPKLNFDESGNITSSINSSESSPNGTKRSSNGNLKCRCTKSNCGSRCQCRKGGLGCSWMCKCVAEKCTNHHTANSDGSAESSETTLNTTFGIGNDAQATLTENGANKRLRLGATSSMNPSVVTPTPQNGSIERYSQNRVYFESPSLF